MCIYLFICTNEFDEFNLICNCNSNKYIEMPKKSVKKENAFVEVQQCFGQGAARWKIGVF